MSNDHIACCISIPKCGSKSLLRILGMSNNRDWEGDYRSVSGETSLIIYENHQRLSILERDYDLSDKFVFCFIRNPYDRIISWWNFHFKMYFYKKYDTIDMWINDGCQTHWSIQNKTNWKEEKLTPLLQYNFIDCSDRSPDFIGKMENFEEDLKEIIIKINEKLEKKSSVRRLSYTPARSNTSIKYITELSISSKEKVYELFKKDFIEFGYDK